jgi:hypothetical protein
MITVFEVSRSFKDPKLELNPGQVSTSAEYTLLKKSSPNISKFGNASSKCV